LRLAFIISLCFIYSFLLAQKENDAIAKGNEAYVKGDYATAENYYSKAIEQNNKNATAYYNKANALYKQNKWKEAADMYATA